MFSKIKTLFFFVVSLLIPLAFIFGKRQQKQEEKVEDLTEALEGAKRVQEVPVNVDRDSAIKRLSKSGHLRD